MKWNDHIASDHLPCRFQAYVLLVIVKFNDYQVVYSNGNMTDSGAEDGFVVEGGSTITTQIYIDGPNSGVESLVQASVDGARAEDVILSPQTEVQVVSGSSNGGELNISVVSDPFFKPLRRNVSAYVEFLTRSTSEDVDGLTAHLPLSIISPLRPGLELSIERNMDATPTVQPGGEALPFRVTLGTRPRHDVVVAAETSLKIGMPNETLKAMPVSVALSPSEWSTGARTEIHPVQVGDYRNLPATVNITFVSFSEDPVYNSWEVSQEVIIVPPEEDLINAAPVRVTTEDEPLQLAAWQTSALSASARIKNVTIVAGVSEAEEVNVSLDSHSLTLEKGKLPAGVMFAGLQMDGSATVDNITVQLDVTSPDQRAPVSLLVDLPLELTYSFSSSFPVARDVSASTFDDILRQVQLPAGQFGSILGELSFAHGTLAIVNASVALSNTTGSEIVKVPPATCPASLAVMYMEENDKASLHIAGLATAEMYVRALRSILFASDDERVYTAEVSVVLVDAVFGSSQEGVLQASKTITTVEAEAPPSVFIEALPHFLNVEANSTAYSRILVDVQRSQLDFVLDIVCQPALGDTRVYRNSSAVQFIASDEGEARQGGQDILGVVARLVNADGSLSQIRSSLTKITIQLAPLDLPPRVAPNREVAGYACNVESNDDLECPQINVSLPIRHPLGDASELVQEVFIHSEPTNARFLRLVNESVRGDVRVTTSLHVQYLAGLDSRAAEQGNDSFVLVAKDVFGRLSDPGKVSVDVSIARPENSAPEARSMALETAENSRLAAELDASIPADLLGPEPLEILSTTFGSVSKLNSQNFTVEYEPPLNFVGVDRFSYMVHDIINRQSAEKVVEINVTDINNTPVLPCTSIASSLLRSEEQREASSSMLVLRRILSAPVNWDESILSREQTLPSLARERLHLVCGENYTMKGVVRDHTLDSSESKRNSITIVLFSTDVDLPSRVQYQVVSAPMHGNVYPATLFQEGEKLKLGAIDHSTALSSGVIINSLQNVSAGSVTEAVGALVYVPHQDNILGFRGDDVIRWRPLDGANSSVSGNISEIFLGLQCSPGERMLNGSTCEMCPLGTYNDPAVLDQHQCFPTPLGYVGAQRALTSRKRYPCGNGLYSDELGLSLCKRCPSYNKGATSSTPATAVTDCICDISAWNAAEVLTSDEDNATNSYTIECKKCDEETMICDEYNQAAPKPREGYYIVPSAAKSPNASRASISRVCVPKNACVRYANSSAVLSGQCAKGYSGDACRECEMGYHREWINGITVCKQCPVRRKSHFAAVAFLALLALVLFMRAAQSSEVTGSCLNAFICSI